MKRCYTYCVFLLLLVPFALQAKPKSQNGVWPFKINRFDKEGRHHGRWKLYQADNTTLLRNGRFKHGKERGKWRYYYPDGSIRKIEYHKPNTNEYLIKLFHDNGALEKKGMARVVETERTIHYFWFGTWEVYNRAGQLTHTEYYEKGHEIKLDLSKR
jgi:antitoxin component YwqK of YwqJK toxin-antitoxin module